MLSDVAPTILSGLGLPVPSSMLGTDLWPLWSGTADARARLRDLGYVE
jgi:arylsulfatase A-like enzyme